LGISARGTGAGLGARSFGGSRIGVVGGAARPPIGSHVGVSAARLTGTGNRFAGTGRAFGLAGSARAP
jgi:hypothetical protein